MEFEVLTMVTMKNTVFWNITSCSLVQIYRRYGRSCFHLQGRPEGISKRFFEPFANLYQTARRRIPEDSSYALNGTGINFVNWKIFFPVCSNFKHVA
jgi:hypothetical protein